jgi:hypothetical protein
LLLLYSPDNYFALLNQHINEQCGPAKQSSMVRLFVTRRTHFEREMKKLTALCKKIPALVI